ETEASGWLYTWSLGIPASSDHPDEAWDFIAWMTDKDYPHLVAEELRWERVPPRSRTSTYHIPEYAEVAAAFARPTVWSMVVGDQERARTAGGRYDGLHCLAVHEAPGPGPRVGQQSCAALAGELSVDAAPGQARR